jgi:hypothetical protein
LLEGSYKLSQRINIVAGVGQDAGDISDNTGGNLRIEWFLK